MSSIGKRQAQHGPKEVNKGYYECLVNGVMNRNPMIAQATCNKEVI